MLATGGKPARPPAGGCRHTEGGDRPTPGGEDAASERGTGGDRLRQRTGALGARDRGARLGHRLPRRHRRQRRAAANRRGLRRADELAAVDPQRLHADARVADPARRLARRPLRPPPHLRRRRRLVHGRVAALRDRAERRGADRGATAAGGRRSAADAGQPGDDRIELPARRPGPGDRRLVGARRRRHRARPAARRLAGRGRLLAGDLSDQRPDRRVRGADGDPPRPRDPRRRRPRPSRRPRSPARRGRTRRHHLRADPGTRAGHVGVDRRRRAGRRPGAGRLPLRRTPQPASDDAARALLLAAVQRRQPRHLRRLRRPQRRLLPARRLPADRRRLLPGRRRRRLAAGDGADAAALGPLRRARAADRRPDPAHGRAAGDRAGDADDGPDRPRSRATSARCCPPWSSSDSA